MKEGLAIDTADATTGGTLVEIGTLDNRIIRHRNETTMDNNRFTIEIAQEFHRRMAAIIDAVQAGVWESGVHDLLASATDYGVGQKRGVQTLALKTGHRSAYVRLHWDTILGDAPTDRQLVADAIGSAINELT